jgi:2-aminobenzoate-CoA ligase
MSTAATAHIDTFARDNLPPRSAWPELLLDLPELRYGDRLNAASALLDENVGEFGDRPCVHLPDGGSWSYAELALRSNQIAHVLVEDLGLVPGNRVLLRATNTPELIACWFAVLKAGGVAVTTMPLLRAGELEKVIDKAEISHALTDVRIADELTEAAGAEAGDDLRARRRAGRPGGPQALRLPGRRYRGRRCGADRLHLRHHRRAEGVHPLSPRHPCRV